MTTVRPKLRRTLRVFLLGTGLAAVLSFLAAIGASKLYWGYFIRRPGLDRRVHQVEQVTTLTALRSVEQPDGSMRFVANDGYDIADRLSVCRDQRPWVSYYCLEERILAALAEHLHNCPLCLTGAVCFFGEDGLLYCQLPAQVCTKMKEVRE